MAVGETKPIAEKLPIGEQLIDAYGLYAEADSDEDEARHKRRFFALAKTVGRREIGVAIREGLRRAQAAGPVCIIARFAQSICMTTSCTGPAWCCPGLHSRLERSFPDR